MTRGLVRRRGGPAAPLVAEPGRKDAPWAAYDVFGVAHVSSGPPARRLPRAGRHDAAATRNQEATRQNVRPVFVLADRAQTVYMLPLNELYNLRKKNMNNSVI